MKVTEKRTTVLQPYFYTHEERLDRGEQGKGADPRTEQTTRAPDWGNLAEIRRAKSEQITLSREGVQRFLECQSLSSESQFLLLLLEFTSPCLSEGSCICARLTDPDLESGCLVCNGSRTRPDLPSIHIADDRVIHTQMLNIYRFVHFLTVFVKGRILRFLTGPKS